MKASGLVDLLADVGVVSRDDRHWKVAMIGRLHQWLKWDKNRFVEVDAVRKLWALRPEYYATLKSRAA